MSNRRNPVKLYKNIYLYIFIYNYKHWGKRGFAASGMRAPGGRVPGGPPRVAAGGGFPPRCPRRGGVGPKMRHLVLYKLAGF